jgi:RNA polymerase sigma factor (sigma-70 family)
MNDDSELLRRFADEGSQAAFAELVRRTVNFVYAAALRQTNGDTHLAQDVTQAVYLALAGQAGVLKRHPVLTGWLHTTTRFLAIRTVRTQTRWLRREQEANSMNTLLHEAEPAWESLRPVIDEALHELDEKDRTALLLRYFEGRSLAEVGANIGLNENSARMRVERALEKLRGRLARRGVTSTAAAIGLVLANQPAVAAPPGFAAVVTGPALAGAAAGSGGVWLFGGLIGTAKLALALIGTALAVGTGGYLVGRYQGAASEAARQAAARPMPPVASQAMGAAAKPAERNPAVEASPTVAQRLNEFTDDVAQKRARQEAAVVAVASSAPTGLVDGSLRPMPTAGLQKLADLKTRKIFDVGITFVSADGKLDPAFGELFALTPEEQTALQRSTDRARDRLAELERANAVVTRDETGNARIAVKSFAAEGGRVYDELMKSFAGTLGRERNGIFLKLGAEQVERALGQFGAVERTVTVAFNPASDRTSYWVTEELNSGVLYHSNREDGYRDLQEVEHRYGTIIKLLPAGFGAAKTAKP